MSEGNTINLKELGLEEAGNKLWEEMEAQLRIAAQKKIESNKKKADNKKVIKIRRQEAKVDRESKIRVAARKISADRLTVARCKRSSQNDVVEKNLLPQLSQALTAFIAEHGQVSSGVVLLNLGDRDGFHGFSIFLENTKTNRKYSKAQVLQMAEKATEAAQDEDEEQAEQQAEQAEQQAD